MHQPENQLSLARGTVRFDRTRPGLARLRRRTLLALTFLATLASLLAMHGPDRGSAQPALNPLAALTRDARDDAPLGGRVVERLSAGSYTYLAVLAPGEDAPRWVVTLGKGAPLGSRVKVRSFGRRTDFSSRRLARTFPELVFGMVSTIP